MLLELTEAHVEHDGLTGRASASQSTLSRFALAVAGDERQRLRVIAMRERNARVRGAACRGSDARHDFEANACSRERFELFAAAAEDERIAAFQPAHALALAARASPAAR